MLSPTFAISMPGGAEWWLILAGAAFLYAWIKIIIEILTGKFSSDIKKLHSCR